MDLKRNRIGRCGVDTSGSGEVPVTSCCEHGNEPLSPTKSGEFLYQLSNYQLLKKGAAQQSQLIR
jgi:hypothetical protein